MYDQGSHHVHKAFFVDLFEVRLQLRQTDELSRHSLLSMLVLCEKHMKVLIRLLVRACKGTTVKEP